MASADYWQRGETLDYINGTGAKINAGDILLLGDRLGVAGCDIPDGAAGSVHVTGVFKMPKDYGDSGKALAIGQAVYWDDTNGCIKAAVAQEVSGGSVSTEATPVHGYAAAPALTTDQTAYIKINA